MAHTTNRNRYLIAAGILSATLVTGCGSEEKKWKASPGTKGFLNLDQVKSAFQKNPKVADFEKRINEIFEGDNLIILDSKTVSDGFAVTALEDLDKDKKKSPADDTLFILTVENRRATLRGYGANSYYKESWAFNPPAKNTGGETHYHRHYHSPYFYHWYWGRGWGHYYTPFSRYSMLGSHRSTYRQGSAFRSQVKSNAAFENRMSKKYGTGFRKSVSSQSSSRRSYVKTRVASTNFKSSLRSSKSSSGWGVRSKTGTNSRFGSSRSSSRGFGGFRGSSGMGI